MSSKSKEAAIMIWSLENNIHHKILLWEIFDFFRLRSYKKLRFHEKRSRSPPFLFYQLNTWDICINISKDNIFVNVPTWPNRNVNIVHLSEFWNKYHFQHRILTKLFFFMAHFDVNLFGYRRTLTWVYLIENTVHCVALWRFVAFDEISCNLTIFGSTYLSILINFK